MYPHVKKMPEIDNSPAKAERLHKADSPSVPPEPAHLLILDFSSPEFWESDFCGT